MKIKKKNHYIFRLRGEIDGDDWKIYVNNELIDTNGQQIRWGDKSKESTLCAIYVCRTLGLKDDLEDFRDSVIATLPQQPFSTEVYYEPAAKESKFKSFVYAVVETSLPAIILACILAGLTGCVSVKASKVETIDPQVQQELNQYKSYEQAYNEGYQKALDECEEKLVKEIEQIKGAVLYQRLAENGIIEQPVVIPVFIRGKTEEGRLVSPRIEWRIVKPARFVSYDRVRKTMLNQRSFVWLGEFDDLAEAKRWVNNNLKLFDESDEVHYIKVEGEESKYAVVVETSPSLSDDYIDFYENSYQIY